MTAATVASIRIDDRSFRTFQPRSVCSAAVARTCAVNTSSNDSRDVGIVIDAMDRIRHLYGSAVLAITHTGHDDKSRERGSSALLGAADCRVKISGDQPLTVDLEAVKVKDFGRGEQTTLHLEPVRRSLAITRASTKEQARDADLRTAILTFVAANPRASQRDIEKGAGKNAADIRNALMTLIESRDVLREDGPRGSYVHTLATASGASDAVGRSDSGNPPLTASASPRSKGDAVTEPQSQPLTASENAGRPLVRGVRR